MLYSGDDFTLLPVHTAGRAWRRDRQRQCGACAGRDIVQACREGKWREAKALDDSLQPLNKALFVESNPIPVKWAVSQMGLIGPIFGCP